VIQQWSVNAGTATCGLSAANVTCSFSDGGVLVLTVSVMADRLGARYGEQVAPDEIVTDPSQAVQRAVEWLTTGHQQANMRTAGQRLVGATSRV